MQRAALLLSGAGAATAGQRRGARATPPALSPGGARALHDVPRAAVRPPPGDARGRVSLRRLRRGRRRRRQEHQQKLKHRRPKTEGQKAHGRVGTVTPPPSPPFHSTPLPSPPLPPERRYRTRGADALRNLRLRDTEL